MNCRRQTQKIHGDDGLIPRWILPTTSTNAANGLTYDVVNRKGEVVERVQLPKDRALAGFGPHNVVYLTRNEAGKAYLERALLTGPK